MTTIASTRPKSAARPSAVAAVLAMAAFSGCYQEPNRFDKVQQETRRNAPAVSKAAMPGSSFNVMFPKKEGDFDVVYSQEKDGFAQAKLVKAGQDVATFAVFDTVSNPEAADKFKDTTETFEGSPIMDMGERGTSLLVGGRYQVQIRSVDANFSKFDREDWLKKFDLANLAKLK